MHKIFVTISPPPRTGRIPHLYLDDTLHIRLSLKGVKRWIIYPELDKKDRLHYHGIVSMSDHEYVTFYRRSRPMLEKLGFIQTSKIENLTENLRTILYCQKQWGYMKDLLQVEYPLIAFHPPRKFRKLHNEIEDRIVQQTFEYYGFKID